MIPRRYRQAPRIVEAMQLTRANAHQVAAWIYNTGHGVASVSVTTSSISPADLEIATYEARLTARPGDWVIRGETGEISVCPPEPFALTYNPVEETQ